MIVERAASILGVPVEAEGALEIARRSRGTPRVGNRLLRRVRDFAEVRGDGVIRVGPESAEWLGPGDVIEVDANVVHALIASERGVAFHEVVSVDSFAVRTTEFVPGLELKN